MLERFIGQVLERPKFVLAIVGAITLFFAFQARALSVDFSLEQLFPRQDVEKDAYLQFKSDFVTDDNLTFCASSRRGYRSCPASSRYSRCPT